MIAKEGSGALLRRYGRSRSEGYHKHTTKYDNGVALSWLGFLMSTLRWFALCFCCRAKTQEFRRRLSSGESLDDVLEEAFAVVREAAWRVLELRHYDVQVLLCLVFRS